MSPINPLIPLGIRTPRVQSPLESYGQMMSLRDFSRRGQIQDLQLEKLRQEEAQRQRDRKGQGIFIDLMRSNTTTRPDGTVKTNPAAIRSGLIKAGYSDLAQQYEQGRLKLGEWLSKKSLADLKLEREEVEFTGQLAGAVLDSEDPAAAYQWAKNKGTEWGLDLAELPPEFSPELLPNLEMLRWGSLSTTEQLDRIIEKKSPKIAQAWLALVSQTMGPSKSQSKWAVNRGFLKKKGVPADILARVPETYSPEAWQSVTRMGLTPSQQQPVAGRDVPLSPEVEAQRGRMAQAARAPKTETGDTRAAKAEYSYQQRVIRINNDRAEEMQALQDRAGMAGASENLTAAIGAVGKGTAQPSRIDRGRFLEEAEAIQKKYADLLEAARREYLAEGGEAPTARSKPAGNIPEYDPATGEFQ